MISSKPGHVPAAIAVLLALATTQTPGADTDTYASQIQAWREKREDRLKADGGWLTVAGLFWLEEGVNRFGTDPSNEIVLPADSAPARAGRFEHHGRSTTVILEAGVEATVGGRAITTMELKP